MSMTKPDERYKDKMRHGGKRGELIAKFGLVCSACGVSGSGFNIVAHHLTGDPQNHSVQVLLCRRCHAKVHLDGRDKKQLGAEEVATALGTAESISNAAKDLGISRTMLRNRRKRYGLMGRSCGECGKIFTPTPSLRKYCTVECAVVGKQKRYETRIAVPNPNKAENDRRYRERHKEAVAEKKRQYYLGHADIFKARAKAWHETHKKVNLPGAVA
jgi:hypothetical protein